MPKSDRLSPAATKMLQEKHLAQLATILPDGSPHVTPVWVDAEDDGSFVLINTVEGRLKLNNISRNQHVAVSIVDAEDWRRYVLVRGVVEEQTKEGAGKHIEKLSMKYRGEHFHHATDDRVILRIRPVSVTEHGA